VPFIPQYLEEISLHTFLLLHDIGDLSTFYPDEKKRYIYMAQLPTQRLPAASQQEKE